MSKLERAVSNLITGKSMTGLLHGFYEKKDGWFTL